MSDPGLFAPPADPALPPDLAGRDLRLLAAGVDAVFQLLLVLGTGIASVVAVMVSGFGHHTFDNYCASTGTDRASSWPAPLAASTPSAVQTSDRKPTKPRSAIGENPLVSNHSPRFASR